MSYSHVQFIQFNEICRNLNSHVRIALHLTRHGYTHGVTTQSRSAPHTCTITYPAILTNNSNLSASNKHELSFFVTSVIYVTLLEDCVSMTATWSPIHVNAQSYCASLPPLYQSYLLLYFGVSRLAGGIHVGREEVSHHSPHGHVGRQAVDGRRPLLRPTRVRLHLHTPNRYSEGSSTTKGGLGAHLFHATLEVFQKLRHRVDVLQRDANVQTAEHPEGQKPQKTISFIFPISNTAIHSPTTTTTVLQELKIADCSRCCLYSNSKSLKPSLLSTISIPSHLLFRPPPPTSPVSAAR